MSDGPPNPLEDLSASTPSGNGKVTAPTAPIAPPLPTPAPAPVPPQPSKKGKGYTPPATIQKILPRSGVAKKGVTKAIGVQLDQEKDFEENLTGLLNRALEVTQHDREMAMALFQVHLDRGEELDGLALTMPVAQVIGDNTGATLKSLELAMKAGDRVVKVAELLARAKKEDLANIINYLKVSLKIGEDDDEAWADTDELPAETPPQIVAPAETAGD